MKGNHTIIVFLCAVLALSACQPAPLNPAEDLKATSTAAMKTVEALGTQLSVLPTTTPPGGVVVTPPTKVPTPTIKPSNTPAPVITATAVPTEVTPWNSCDAAALVDETISDGAKLEPGTKFVKTWTLQNIGSCTWTSDYKLVFDSGEAMTTSISKAITAVEVKPGDSVTVSVKMTAPEIAGDYTGFWKLANGQGYTFGLTGVGKPFWVYIKVGPETRDKFAVLSAPVTVYPTTFKGYCGSNGVVVYFTGWITTNKAGKVVYHFEGTDIGDSPHEIIFVGADTMKVYHTWEFRRGYHENWVRLVIDSPNNQTFQKTEYDVECTN
ncbi:MAG: hypothetical protein C0391_00790 [Anaerolinea sp.]|nr:hypothetical protein [Anaerolinea sp.]